MLSSHCLKLWKCFAFSLCCRSFWSCLRWKRQKCTVCGRPLKTFPFLLFQVFQHPRITISVANCCGSFSIASSVSSYIEVPLALWELECSNNPVQNYSPKAGEGLSLQHSDCSFGSEDCSVACLFSVGVIWCWFYCGLLTRKISYVWVC